MKLNKHKLNIIRARKGLTLQEMYRAAKVASNTVIKGYDADIDPVTVGRIAKALDVDVTEIID